MRVGTPYGGVLPPILELVREQGCSSWGATVLGCTCGALTQNCRVSRAESVADAKDSSIITVLSLADTTLVGEALTELREVV